jgi:hypothetical protein
MELDRQNRLAEIAQQRADQLERWQMGQTGDKATGRAIQAAAGGIDLQGTPTIGPSGIATGPKATFDPNAPANVYKQQSKEKPVNIGGQTTTAVPGKGVWNPVTKQYDKSVENTEKPGTQAGAGGAMDPMLKIQYGQYQKDVKPFKDAVVNYVNAKSAMDEALAKNPQAYASTLANFVRTTDANPQMRYATLMYFKNTLGASMPGNLEILAQRIESGTYPPEVLQNMVKHMGHMGSGLRDKMNMIRSEYVRRYPALDAALPKAETYFSSDIAPEGAPGATTSAADSTAKAARNAARAKLGLPPV